MRDRFWAAWVLVAGLFVLSLPRPPPAPQPCPHPRWRDGALRCDEPDAPPLEGPLRTLFGLPLDLNRADAATLETLPGIGPSRAGAIVAGRPYDRVRDLLRVPGIGRVLLARISPREPYRSRSRRAWV